MKTRSFLLTAVLLLLGTCAASAADQLKVTVKNPISIDRNGEMVEVALEVVKSRMGTTNVIVTDADGREIPSQQTQEGLLIWQVGVGGNASSVYYIKKGSPSTTYDNKVFGRKFPERADDMAWENDLVAFRCYGPQLQKNGEKAYGYDIWNKRTDKLVVEERYASELSAETAAQIAALRAEGKNDEADDLYNSVSYHVDHGTGMDCYKVGPTLGAGATALLTYDTKEIIYPYCYESCEVLDNGPLRFTVKLVYEKKEYNYGEGIAPENVQETRIITLDAGSQMNRVRVSYDGLSRTVPAAVGIVVHPENPNAFVLSNEKGYMGYEDLGDPNQYKEKYRATQNADFGKIYVGAVFKKETTGMVYQPLEGVSGTSGHILGLTEVGPWRQLTYYFGSGWSRNPATSFSSLTDWEAYLSNFAQQVKNPLEIVM